MKKQYIIRSTQRDEPNAYFVAIHSFTPFYGEKKKARAFSTSQEAHEYAISELFTSIKAVEIVEVF